MSLIRKISFSRPTQNVFEKLIADSPFPNLTKTVKVGHLIGSGGFADVFEASMKVKGKSRMKVAVKKFRVIIKMEDNVAQTYSRELLIWGKLKHRNVLKLLGIMLMDGVPCMVSEWMENGAMPGYLKANDNVNILELIQDIACGLAYLHIHEVVHSDLKGENVLISADGRAVLSDFGTSRLLKNGVTIAGTQTFKGSARWTAPELFTPASEPTKHLLHTKESDVWAFGMVVYEALSRRLPFETRSEAQVISSITNGVLPPRPDGTGVVVTDSEVLWECCQRCWSSEPAHRPQVPAIKEQLKCKNIFIDSMYTVQASRSWMSPTGRFLAIRGEDEKSLSFLELRTLNKHGHGLSATSAVWSVGWSNTEEHIVTLSEDGTLRKWSNILEGPVVVAQSTQKHDYASPEFSPNDGFIVSVPGTAKLWDASNLALIWEYPGVWPTVAFHPLGNRLVFFGWLRDVLDVNIEDLGNITSTDHKVDFDVYRLVFGPSGNTCVADTDKGVKILSGDTVKGKNSLPIDDYSAMQLTADGKYILFVLSSKEVVLWDIAGGKAVEELSVPVALESVDGWSAEISKNCRVVRLITSNGDTRTTHVLHVTSSYY